MSFFALELVAVFEVPQLFVLTKKGGIVLLVGKIVNKFLLTGTDGALCKYITIWNHKIELGEAGHGPGTFRFYGMKIIQYAELGVSIQADNKLNHHEPYPLSRAGRFQDNEKMNDAERKLFVYQRVNWIA